MVDSEMHYKMHLSILEFDNHFLINSFNYPP